ncbi:MAG: hypothetical protein KatS3mg008_2036 [Acidimicrobiales bacterium]|nr:MAG: hypothetical protein KatS3mg008_2036 [Acidimicrobiales bacterium]
MTAVTETGADSAFHDVASRVLAWMKEHGFDDAELREDAGAGIYDIDSSRAIAEIAVGAPPNRPDIQRLDTVSRQVDKPAMFFSLRGFTLSAQEWADNVGVALFEIRDGAEDGSGDEPIVPLNKKARDLVKPKPSREEALARAAARALAAARAELAREKGKDVDEETLRRIEEAKRQKALRRNLLR